MTAKVWGWIASLLGGFYTLFGAVLLLVDEPRWNKYLRPSALFSLLLGLSLLTVGIVCLHKIHKKSIIKNKVDELFELKRLLDAGIITEVEFKEKKRQLLD